MGAAPSPSFFEAVPSGETQCLGFAMLTKLDASDRMFYGSATKLWELVAGTWTDRSRGGAYSLSDATWSFTQFGDVSIAGNADNVLQASSSGAFANVAGSPQAKIVESVLTSGGGFVFAFNTDAGADVWKCSAVNDHTDWTPSIATQCTTGRLLGSEGPIIAAKKLGADRIVAYKARSLYVGTYVGGDAAWSWQEYPGYGCVGKDAVADLGTEHFVASASGLYIFDGVRPQTVGQELSLAIMQYLTSSSYNYYDVKVSYEKRSDLVRVFYSTGNTSGTTNACVAYNTYSRMWGRHDVTVQCVAQVKTSSAHSTHIMTSVGRYSLTGTAGSSSFRTNWFGDDDAVSSLTMARVRYDAASFVGLKYPTSASVQAYSSMWLRDSTTTGPSTSYTDSPGGNRGRFPMRQTARWHNLVFSFTGDHSVAGFDVKLAKVGNR